MLQDTENRNTNSSESDFQGKASSHKCGTIHLSTEDACRLLKTVMSKTEKQSVNGDERIGSKGKPTVQLDGPNEMQESADDLNMHKHVSSKLQMNDE